MASAMLATLLAVPGCTAKEETTDDKTVTTATGPDGKTVTNLSGLEKNIVTTASGLKYIDLVVGSGASPATGKQVKVHYTGALENGKKFDSSVDRGEPFVFVIGVGQVIPGWDQGVMTMKVGGKRKLIIPGNLGYGASGSGNDIPPNTTLYFDVELLDAKQ